jgi:peroxiredoxin Q/BCP
LLRVGDTAPDFALPDEDGEPVKLKDRLRRGPVLLVFFPGTVSPASARQLGAIRDRQPELTAAGLQVLAVSPDDLDAHRQFRDAHRLTFPLLADVDRAVAAAYDATGLFGMGTRRGTFLIDGSGRIVDRARAEIRLQAHTALVQRALERHR